MQRRPGSIAAAAIIIVVGLAFGALLAVLARGSSDRPQPVAVTTGPGRTSEPMPIQTAGATRHVVKAAPPASKPRTTPPAPATTVTAAPSPAVRAVPISQAATAPAVVRKLQGSWQVDEANVQVGKIVWLGDAVLSGGGTIVLDAHKESVGGRSAVPCERQTNLHAAFSLGVAQQSVPYRETNCRGIVSTGEVRVQSFSGDGGSFSGSFWQNGVMLGDFRARKL